MGPNCCLGVGGEPSTGGWENSAAGCPEAIFHGIGASSGGPLSAGTPPAVPCGPADQTTAKPYGGQEMPRSRTGWKQIGLLIALTALAQIRTRADAKERLEQQLAAPGGTSASGRARVILRSDSDGRLILSARGLAPNQDFDVIVGGVKVG